MTTIKGEDLGHINSIQCNTTAPLAANYDIELQKLNLIVGMNGAGKSLVLKLNWVFGTIMASLVTHKNSITTSQSFELAQYTLDKTFESQNFNGTIGAKFNKASISIELENGKVTSLEYKIDPCIETAAPPIFMSTTLRTFAQIDQYLKTEALIKSQEDILEMYRLYDVVFIERMKMKLAGGLKVSEEVKDSLKNNFELKVDLDTVSIENKSVVYTDTKGKTSSLAMLSNGEQSLINMILCNQF